MNHLVKGHSYGYEIFAAKQTTGDAEWQKLYRYPLMGLSLIHLYLGNPEQLGNGTGLYAWISLPLARTPHFMTGLRLGTGVGYLTKKFDRVDNFKNSAIGSNVNEMIVFGGEVRFRISNRLLFDTYIGLTHFSNGAYSTPNLGLNIATIHGGLSYIFTPPEPVLNKRYHPDVKASKKMEYQAVIAAGRRETIPPGGDRYWAFKVSGGMLKPLGYKSRIGVGADYFYDRSLHARIISDTTNDVTRTAARIGLYVSHELVLGKLRIVFDTGFYILDEFKKDGPVYSRVGWKYTIYKNLMFNSTLKTHFFKADFFEFGLAMKLR